MSVRPSHVARTGRPESQQSEAVNEQPAAEEAANGQDGQGCRPGGNAPVIVHFAVTLPISLPVDGVLVHSPGLASSDPPGVDNTMAYQLWCVGGRIRCVSRILRTGIAH